MFARLGALVTRFRWPVVVAWIVVTLCAITVGYAVGAEPPVPPPSPMEKLINRTTPVATSESDEFPWPPPDVCAWCAQTTSNCWYCLLRGCSCGS